jgi:alpha-tubulin suppressor-like RCC1 family protein
MNDSHNGPRPRCSRFVWRRRGAAAALVLAVVGAGLTVAGTVAGAVPAQAVTAPEVSAGGGHSCALLADKSVWCWGAGGYGQLGNGTIGDSPVPVRVTGLPPAASVSAGPAPNAYDPAHTCAVDTSGRVWCWGSDDYGQLGNGKTVTYSEVPVQVQGGILATQVSAGDQFTCAVTQAGTVECWGDNDYGELGNGTTTTSTTPVTVKGLTNVIQVAAGYFHACALESSGTVWCWGDNDYGELGNGTTGSISTVPVIASLQTAIWVTAGAGDTCAIVSTGDLLCWGENNAGQLGTGNLANTDLPTQVQPSTTGVSFTSGVDQVSAGFDTTCAIADTPAPAAWCWGGNDSGALGTGQAVNQTTLPEELFGMGATPAGGPAADPVQISAGFHHGCLELSSGADECWGQNNAGQLGTGAILDRNVPTPVIGLPGGAAGSVTAVAEGDSTGCAVTLSLDARCWGADAGNGSTSIQTSAVGVSDLPAGGVSQVVAAQGGCALVRTGGVTTEISCWGEDQWGQLGNGTTSTTPQAKPVTVQKLPNTADFVATGGGNACAIAYIGGAYCWGLNDHGQLGDGTTTDSSVPAAVQNLPPKTKVVQIAPGGDHTCALLNDGTVWCWGAGGSGQLGDGSTSNSAIPVEVTGLGSVVQIASANAFSCALTSAGYVRCWGDNSFGELGDGSTSNSAVPVAVAGLTSLALSVGTNDGAACATLLGGQADCWGDNAFGELGNGSVGTPPSSSSPVPVSGFTAGGPVMIGPGESACALNTSQKAYCWGDNGSGELGDGTSGVATSSGTPVAVLGL